MRLLAAILFLSSGLAYAESSAEPTKHEECKLYGRLAAKLMQARQAGVPISQVIELIASERHELVFAAYELPRASTEEYRRRAIEDFENDIYVECFRNHKDGP